MPISAPASSLNMGNQLPPLISAELDRKNGGGLAVQLFLNSNIPMHVAGGVHPNREAVRRV